MKAQLGILLGSALLLSLHVTQAEAETPLRMWSNATQVGIVCSVEGERQASSASLCHRLARIIGRHVAYPVVHRDAGASGVTFHVALHPERNGVLAGTLQATRPAFQDEADGASRLVPLNLVRAQPDAAFQVALGRIMPAASRASAVSKQSFD